MESPQEAPRVFGKIIYKDFNFVNAREKYLINLVASHGVLTKSFQCKKVFKAFPYADIYEKAENKEGPFGKPGQIQIYGDGVKDRYIINIFGQKFDKSQNQKEPIERRLRYFTSSLYKVFKIKNLESVALHQFIGTDEWGTFWNKYSNVINKFAQKYPHIQTVMYSIQNGKSVIKQTKKAIQQQQQKAPGLQAQQNTSQQKFQSYKNSNTFSSKSSKTTFRSGNRGK